MSTHLEDPGPYHTWWSASDTVDAIKNGQHAEEAVMRCHSCAQCDLFIRLSPEDGDDGLSAMASLLLVGQIWLWWSGFR